MEDLLIMLAQRLGQVLSFVTLLLLATGSVVALVRLVTGPLSGRSAVAVTLDVWQTLSRWLLISLQFLLAADLVETIAKPSWDALGKLGVIALIRAVLGYFLAHDIEGARRVAAEESERALESSPTTR